MEFYYRVIQNADFAHNWKSDLEVSPVFEASGIQTPNGNDNEDFLVVDDDLTDIVMDKERSNAVTNTSSNSVF